MISPTKLLTEATEAEREAFLKMIADAEAELVCFMVWSAATLTELTIKSASNPLLAIEMGNALRGTPDDFLALAHKIHTDIPNYHQHLAEFRNSRETLTYDPAESQGEEALTE